MRISLGTSYVIFNSIDLSYPILHYQKRWSHIRVNLIALGKQPGPSVRNAQT